MKGPTKRTLTGRWRITKMALWDKDFLDMMEPAYIAFDSKLGGEFAFGCVTGDLLPKNLGRRRVYLGW